ncbi:MinD/ParA family protein [Pseudoneobacillus sp. C159]
MDQAHSLREYMNRLNRQQHPQPPLKKHWAKIVTITSGKGGVGKSNFTVNFALALQEAGKKVLILDLDLSTNNINILMGTTPRYSLIDVLYQQKEILDVIEKGTSGIEYISSGLDLDYLMDLDENTLAFFWSQIEALQTYADFILLDTGAGISKELINFILASDETIILTTPEPTAIADAYAVLKNVMRYTKKVSKFHLIVNRAHTYAEAVETSRSLKNACRSFLHFDLPTLGFLLEDTHVRQAVKAQMPFYITSPNCVAAKNIREIVHSYLPDYHKNSSVQTTGLKGFFEKLLSLKKSRK